jgi:hypothetical protein
MKKVKVFESIKGSKFARLERSGLINIKGGVKTEGRTVVLSYNHRYLPDGTYQRQENLKSYSGDDIDGKDECYTDLEYCTGPWTNG